jgi:hypothetical protein
MELVKENKERKEQEKRETEKKEEGKEKVKEKKRKGRKRRKRSGLESRPAEWWWSCTQGRRSCSTSTDGSRLERMWKISIGCAIQGSRLFLFSYP